MFRQRRFRYGRSNRGAYGEPDGESDGDPLADGKPESLGEPRRDPHCDGNPEGFGEPRRDRLTDRIAHRKSDRDAHRNSKPEGHPDSDVVTDELREHVVHGPRGNGRNVHQHRHERYRER